MCTYDEIARYDDIDVANGHVRELVAEDCYSIGITDWNIINEVIRTNNHNYTVICQYKFDDVGNLIEIHGYSVCRKKARK